MDNHLVLAGRICSELRTRYSPAGIPITQFTLEHRSMQTEADRQREAQCRIIVVAAGAELQKGLKGLQTGMVVQASGFLSTAGYRDHESRLVLHAHEIRCLE